MAAYNGNNVSLTINGFDFGTIFRSFTPDIQIGDENVSHGADTDWEKHASKLKVVNATAIGIYDDTTAAADVTAMLDLSGDDIVTVVYGPEGNASGKPKHEQDFLVTRVNGPATNHDKTLVTWELTLISTGEPVTDIYAGGTFS